MRYLATSIAVAAAVSAAVLPHQHPIGNSIDNALYLLELSPGETIWATEDQKWELRRASVTHYNLSSC